VGGGGGVGWVVAGFLAAEQGGSILDVSGAFSIVEAVSIVAEISLCHACSDHEILRVEVTAPGLQDPEERALVVRQVISARALGRRA
jgi:hypothetical protein